MSLAFEIRKLGPKELGEALDFLAAVFMVDKAATAKRLGPRLDSDRHLTLLAKAGGETIGIIECASHPTGVISNIYVLEEYRRNGVAEKLLETCGYWFQGAGVAHVSCEFPIAEESLRGFFSTQGYEPAMLKVVKEIPQNDEMH